MFLRRSDHLLAELKALQSENESLKSQAGTRKRWAMLWDQVQEIKGVKLLAIEG